MATHPLAPGHVLGDEQGLTDQQPNQGGKQTEPVETLKALCHPSKTHYACLVEVVAWQRLCQDC